jgi:uncharacterized protein (TIGR00106 family)
MLLCEFTMAPLGAGESVSPYVARILDIIDRSGLPYQLTPMSTIIEGEWQEVMDLVGECYRELEKDCNRISASIKIDARNGNESRINRKVETVENLLGKKLNRSD